MGWQGEEAGGGRGMGFKEVGMSAGNIIYLFTRNATTIAGPRGAGDVQPEDTAVFGRVQGVLLRESLPARAGDMQRVSRLVGSASKPLPRGRIHLLPLGSVPLHERSTLPSIQDADCCRNLYELYYHPLFYKTSKCNTYNCPFGLVCYLLHDN
jgi:hypothetical protein